MSERKNVLVELQMGDTSAKFTPACAKSEGDVDTGPVKPLPNDPRDSGN